MTLQEQLLAFVRPDRDLDDLLIELETVNMEEAYDDYLDDLYGEIEICGVKYSASVAFYRIDEIAYNCGFSEWLDYELSEDISVTFDDGHSYYRGSEIEELIENLQSEADDG